jgi:hypothetical protein
MKFSHQVGFKSIGSFLVSVTEQSGGVASVNGIFCSGFHETVLPTY